MRIRRGTAAVSEEVPGHECHCGRRLAGRRPGPIDSRARIRPLGCARRCFGLKHPGRSAAARPVQRPTHAFPRGRSVPAPERTFPVPRPPDSRRAFTLIELLGRHRDHRGADRAAVAGGAGRPRGRPPDHLRRTTSSRSASRCTAITTSHNTFPAGGWIAVSDPAVDRQHEHGLVGRRPPLARAERRLRRAECQLPLQRRRQLDRRPTPCSRSTSAPRSRGRRTGTNTPGRRPTRTPRPTPTTAACTAPAAWCPASRTTRPPGR